MDSNKDFSMVISSALLSTTEEQERTTFAELGLGELVKIDMIPATSRGEECLKIYIHYTQATPTGMRLWAKLAENQERQKQGELIPPVKIVYGSTRDGRDRYWQVYAAQTPSQRLASRTAKTDGFKVRIEM